MSYQVLLNSDVEMSFKIATNNKNNMKLNSDLDIIKEVVNLIDNEYEDNCINEYNTFLVNNNTNNDLRKYILKRKVYIETSYTEQELTDSDIRYMEENFKNENKLENHYVISSQYDDDFDLNVTIVASSFDEVAQFYADNIKKSDIDSEDEYDFMIVHLGNNEYKSYSLDVQIKTIDEIIKDDIVTNREEKIFNKHFL